MVSQCFLIFSVVNSCFLCSDYDAISQPVLYYGAFTSRKEINSNYYFSLFLCYIFIHKVKSESDFKQTA